MAYASVAAANVSPGHTDYRPSNLLGLRVVRNSAVWNSNETDGGVGFVGTIVGVTAAPVDGEIRAMIHVNWDSGFQGGYFPQEDGSFELLVYDNAPIGVDHQQKCSFCNDQIVGMMFKCNDCQLHTLCTTCYMVMEDVRSSKRHDGRHRFLRFDLANSVGVLLEPRWNTVLTRPKAKGVFVDATVQRGYGWRFNDNQDGGLGSTGTVKAILNHDQQEPRTFRSCARVCWDRPAFGPPKLSDYSIGHAGAADICCTEGGETEGLYYFPTHLPVVGVPPYAISPECQDSLRPASENAIPPVPIQFQNEVNRVGSSEVNIGDIVKVTASLAQFERLQNESANRWCEEMKVCKDKIGFVERRKSDGCLLVVFHEKVGKWSLAPGVLQKWESQASPCCSFKAGDYVNVIHDKAKLRHHQQSIDYFKEDMNLAVGKPGIVRLVHVSRPETHAEACANLAETLEATVELSHSNPRKFVTLHVDCFERASPARSTPEDPTVSTNHYDAGAAGNYDDASPAFVQPHGQIGAESEIGRFAGARGLGAAATAAGLSVVSFGRGRGRGFTARSGIAAASPPIYQASAVGNQRPQFQAAGNGSLQLAVSTGSLISLGSFDAAATLEQPSLPSGQMSVNAAGLPQQQMQPQPPSNAAPSTSFAAVQVGHLGEVPAQASSQHQQQQYPPPPTFQFADQLHLQSRAGVSNGEAFSGFPSQLRDALPSASFSTPLPASALPTNRYPNLHEFLPSAASVAAPQFAMPPTTAFGAGGYNVPLPPFAYYPPYAGGMQPSFPAAVSMAQPYSVQPTPGMAHNGFGAPLVPSQFFGYPQPGLAHGHLNAMDPIESLMRLAYEGNDPALLSVLHGNPALGCAADINGNTLLHYAIDGNKPATVRLILTYTPKIANAQQTEGASLTHAPMILNVQNADGASPLCFAIEKGALECVQVLLADQGRNINPNLQVHGTKYTAMHLAVARRSADVLDLLLSQDFHAFPLNLTLQEKYRCTAFHLAVKDGFMDAIKLLLQREKTFVNHQMEPAGYTALHYALLGNDVGLVRYLLEQGANPLLAAWADNNLPLHLAITLRKFEFAEVLVLRGDKAQLNAHGGHGETPLSLAWQVWQEEQARTAIDSTSFARLLDFSKQPPIKFRHIEEHIPAVDAPELCMVLFLLANGADQTIVNQITGKPPLEALSDQILAMIVEKFTGFALIPIDPMCRICKQFLADIQFEPCGCKLVCLHCYTTCGWSCGCGDAIEAKKYDGQVFATAADQPHQGGGVSLGIPPFQ